VTLPTPAQTIGPYYGCALPFPGGPDPAPAGHAGTVTVHGRVLDGQGQPVADALLETWQSVPEPLPGSMRRDPVTGGHRGRNGLDFTGFGRVATDADGRWAVRTLPPPAAAPYLSVCLFARGLTRHLFTRIYLARPPADRLLAALPPHRARTLIATGEPGRTYRFDLHLQGTKETVFLDFTGHRST
jgi:protocatechuate 3,4-dioxygenase, alpha subunit